MNSIKYCILLNVKCLSVIWKNIDYNIADAFNNNDGKFTAPVDGIYYFYLQVHSYGSKHADIYLYINGSFKASAYRNEDGHYDTVTLSSQLKLKKGDIVWARFAGYFNSSGDTRYAFFEGHLIRQMN